MNSQKGSAVAIVLMFLAVVSLLGVGLLTQSRLDHKLTASIKSYYKMFSLADGGSAIAFKDLKLFSRELPYPLSSPLNDEGHTSRYYVKNSAGTDIKNMRVDTSRSDSELYLACVMLNGYSTEPADSEGWEVGTFYPEYWVGEGKGKRRFLFGGTGAFTGTDSDSLSSIVHAHVRKMKQSH